MFSLQKHENLVLRLEFCIESAENMFVYEYAYKRSLDLHLTSNDLTWTTCLKICIGMARGLDHLHNLVKKQRKSIASRYQKFQHPFR